MPRSNRELWLALVAALVITLVYLFVVYQYQSIPRASSLFGHGLGVAGFTLMVMTETLYSLRKRTRFSSWGRMSTWLKFHIFTGLVGPFMVLLHTSWKFNGLAGVVTLLTVVIVISGFIGRYIYTAVPRTADGVMLEARELERQIAALNHAIGQAAGGVVPLEPAMAAAQPAPSQGRGSAGYGAVLGRVFADLLEFLRGRPELNASLKQLPRDQARRVHALAQRRRRLQRQMNSIAAARRLLAVWHTIHIPIGTVLFTSAVIHIIAAVYYATLLR